MSKDILQDKLLKPASVEWFRVRVHNSQIITKECRGRTGTDMGTVQVGMKLKTLAATYRAQGDITRADLCQQLANNTMFIGSHEYPSIGTHI